MNDAKVMHPTKRGVLVTMDEAKAEWARCAAQGKVRTTSAWKKNILAAERRATPTKEAIKEGEAEKRCKCGEVRLTAFARSKYIRGVVHEFDECRRPQRDVCALQVRGAFHGDANGRND